MHAGVVRPNIHTLNAAAIRALARVFARSNGHAQYALYFVPVDAAGVIYALAGKILPFAR